MLGTFWRWQFRRAEQGPDRATTPVATYSYDGTGLRSSKTVAGPAHGRDRRAVRIYATGYLASQEARHWGSFLPTVEGAAAESWCIHD